MEQTECSETSAYKIQMPGNYPEESMQQKKNFLKLIILFLFLCFLNFVPRNAFDIFVSATPNPFLFHLSVNTTNESRIPHR